MVVTLSGRLLLAGDKADGKHGKVAMDFLPLAGDGGILGDLAKSNILSACGNVCLIC